MNEKALATYEKALLFFLIGVALSVSVLGLFCVPTADDFVFAAGVRDVGLADFVTDNYMSWTGRIVPVTLIGLSFRNYRTFAFSSAILALALVAIPLIAGHRRMKRTAIPRFAAAVTVVALLFGFSLFLGQLVYWPTGGWAYTFSFLLNAAWLAAYAAPRRLGFRRSMLLFGAGAVAGAAHEQLTLPFLFLAVCAYAGRIREGRGDPGGPRRNLVLGALPIAGMLLGAALLIIAPGNFNRARTFYDGSGSRLGSILASLIPNAIYLLKVQAYSSILPILGAAFAGILIGVVEEDEDAKDPHKNYAAAFRLSLALAIAFLLTLAPLLPLAKFASIRTRFFGAIFLFGATLLFFKTATQFLVSKATKRRSGFAFAAFLASITAMAALVSIGFLSVDLQESAKRIYVGIFADLRIAIVVFFSALAGLLALAIFGGRTGEKAKDAFFEAVSSGRFRAVVYPIAAIVCVVLFVAIIAPQYRMAIPYKAAGDERHAYLLSAGSKVEDGGTVSVLPFSSEPPSWFHLDDLTGDPDFWINKGLVKYYRLGQRKLVLASPSSR